MTLDLPRTKYLEAFSFAHVSDGFCEDDGWDMMNSFMNLEGSPLDEVKVLKDRGNSLFKQKNFDVAAACYDRACKLLGFALGGLQSYDLKNVCDLAVSLNLNLAASAIKLLEFEAANDLCSLVLSSFPQNVKALFRRAVAFMRLKMFIEAKADFERALMVEPKNNDILRELAEVNDYLKINCNGKRTLEADSLRENIHNLSCDSNKKTLVKHGECSSSKSFSDSRLNDKENILKEGKSECLNMELDYKAEVHQVDEKMFNFCKKGDKRCSLRMFAYTYQKLLNGNEVGFYQNYNSTSMKIRILKSSNVEVKPHPEAQSKKKRKRRQKKMKTKIVDTTNEVLALSNNEACERKIMDKKTITEVSVESVETLMVVHNIGVEEDDLQQIQDTHTITEVSAESVETLMVVDNIGVEEDDLQQIQDTHLISPRSSASTRRKTFKRFPKSLARLYMNQSGDADPPDVSSLKALATSTVTRLRVLRFRQLRVTKIHEIKNPHPFTRFPSNRKTKFTFPRFRDVSLYCSINNLSNAKRKSAENFDFMNFLFRPTKKQCRNQYPNSSFSFSSTFMLNKPVCNYGSESQNSV